MCHCALMKKIIKPLKIQVMKTTQFLLVILTTLGILSSAKAQSSLCSSFTITNVYADSMTSGQYQISIDFQDTASTFVNYPYVSAVLDCSGDTVATGNMFYFGHPSGASQDYPVNAIGSMSCLPLTAVFIYGDSFGNTDTCLLTFGTTGIFKPETDESAVLVYPNPTQNIISFNSTLEEIGKAYTLVDPMGKAVLSGRIVADKTTIDLTEQSSGIYLLNVDNQQGKTSRIVKE